MSLFQTPLVNSYPTDEFKRAGKTQNLFISHFQENFEISCMILVDEKFKCKLTCNVVVVVFFFFVYGKSFKACLLKKHSGRGQTPTRP